MEEQVWVIRELICVGCGYRYIDAHPPEMWLKEIVCPNCQRQGHIIMTGQELEEN